MARTDSGAPLASGFRWRLEPEPPEQPGARSPAGLFTSGEWLRAQSALLGSRLAHLAVRDDRTGTVRAAAPLATSTAVRGMAFQPELYFRTIAARTPSRWPYFAVNAGLAAGYHSSVWIPPVDETGSGEACAALLDGLEACAHERGAMYVALLFAPVEVAAAVVAVGRPVTSRLVPVGHASIELPGTRPEHYLASLTQKAAQNVRREMEAGRRLGLEIERRALAARPPGLDLLAEEVERRYRSGVRAADIGAELSALTDAFGDRAMLFLGSYEGELVGFTLAVEHRGTLYMRRVGLAYRRLRGAFEYFNLGYYAPLEHCYANGLSRLQLGCGAADAKLLRGASISPLFHVLVGVSGGDDLSGEAAAFWRERMALRPGGFPERAWTAAFRLASRARSENPP